MAQPLPTTCGNPGYSGRCHLICCRIGNRLWHSIALRFFWWNREGVACLSVWTGPPRSARTAWGLLDPKITVVVTRKSGKWSAASTGGGRLLSSGTRLPPPLPPPPPPPPPLYPPGPLSCQGSTATGRTYGGAEGAQNFFFSFPLPILSTLHPNTILEPNLDSNAHPNPQPTPNPTHKPYP